MTKKELENMIEDAEREYNTLRRRRQRNGRTIWIDEAVAFACAKLRRLRSKLNKGEYVD